MLDGLISTAHYTSMEVFFYWTGFFLWAAAYFIMMFKIPKAKFVDMPVLVASGNIAWEFLWATIFSPILDMGPLLVWLYRVGFLFDCWIFYNVYKYGWKQWSIPAVLKHYKWALTGITISWLGIFYTYTTGGHDNVLGTFSAMQLNLIISPLCCLMIWKMNTTEGFIISVGWLKMLGTLMVTTFVFSKFPDEHYIQVVGILIAVFDNWYIYSWYRIRSREQSMAVASRAVASQAA